MIIFRPFRNSLDESMKEAVEFDTIDELGSYISEKWNVDESNITIDVSEGDDDRIWWSNCRRVSLIIEKSKYDMPLKLFDIGMCSFDW